MGKLQELRHGWHSSSDSSCSERLHPTSSHRSHAGLHDARHDDPWWRAFRCRRHASLQDYLPTVAAIGPRARTGPKAASENQNSWVVSESCSSSSPSSQSAASSAGRPQAVTTTWRQRPIRSADLALLHNPAPRSVSDAMRALGQPQCRSDARRDHGVDLTGQLSNPQPALCHLAGEAIRPSGEGPKAEQHPPKPTRRPRVQTQRRLSADQIAELIAAYRSGKTMKELASEFGIHRTTVSSHLTEHGVSVRRGGLDQDQTAEAVRLYEQGWSSGRLSEKFGVSADTVLTVLRRARVSIRPRRGGPHGRKD